MRSSLFSSVPHCHLCLQSGGATNFMDRAIINCAHYLEEALAWGFDIDVWRAHLNAQTWPEVNSLLCFYISVVQLVLEIFSPRSHTWLCKWEHILLLVNCADYHQWLQHNLPATSDQKLLKVLSLSQAEVISAEANFHLVAATNGLC